MEIRFAANIEWVQKSKAALSPIAHENEIKPICDDKGYIYRGIILPWNGTKTKLALTCPDHGDWNTTSIGKLKAGRGCPSCGAENSAKAVKIPTSVLLENANRVCEKYNYTCLGFVDKPSARAYLRLKCNTHNHIWENTNYNNFMKPRSIGGCPICEAESIVERFKLKPDEVANRIVDICKAKGYIFAGFVNGWHGNLSCIRVKCLKHGDISEVRYVDFIKETSEPCCKCRKYGFMTGKTGRFYVQTLDDKFVKFGITNKDTKQRIAQQQRKSKFNHVLVYEAEFHDGKKALNLETWVKQNFVTGVVSRDDLGDGWTETTYIENLPVLLKEVKNYINMNR
ncbi:TPA: hypothetical protein ACVQ7F_000116 [Salmonella enterica subsp. enterica serovar Muenchen]